MASLSRVGKVHTKVFDDGGDKVVRYWGTEVVRFNDSEIILRNAGYYTATTKVRMNQASRQFGLGFSVSQRGGEWFVSFKGEELPFNDGMRLER